MKFKIINKASFGLKRRYLPDEEYEFSGSICRRLRNFIRMEYISYCVNKH